MESYFNKLPTDIQELILSKIYYPQPKILLDDIQNFTKSKRKIIQHYKKLETTNKNKYFWLTNDLTLYFNDYICYGIETKNFTFSKGNIEKLNRLFIIQHNVNKTNIYINFHDLNCYNNNIPKLKTMINRYLGCLTSSERLNFIKKMIS